MWVLPMSQFHHGWLHVQTSQGTQEAVPSQLSPYWVLWSQGETWMSPPVEDLLGAHTSYLDNNFVFVVSFHNQLIKKNVNGGKICRRWVKELKLHNKRLKFYMWLCLTFSNMVFWVFSVRGKTWQVWGSTISVYVFLLSWFISCFFASHTVYVLHLFR